MILEAENVDSFFFLSLWITWAEAEKIDRYSISESENLDNFLFLNRKKNTRFVDVFRSGGKCIYKYIKESGGFKSPHFLQIKFTKARMGIIRRK